MHFSHSTGATLSADVRPGMYGRLRPWRRPLMRPSQARCSSDLLASREVGPVDLVEQVILLTMCTARRLKDITVTLRQKFKHDKKLNVLRLMALLLQSSPNRSTNHKLCVCVCVYICECRTD